MTILTPIAVSSAPLLRAIQAGGDLSGKALAEAAGRKPNNITRDLGALEKAGLITREPGSPPALTDDGVAVLAELDGGVTPVPVTLPNGMVELHHEQIWPDSLNPRQFVPEDEEAIEELANSIARDGLLENLVVRVGETEHGAGFTTSVPVHRLVAGERRHRAIGKLIADGRWPADRKLVCKVVDIDDAAHRRIALVENLQRKDLRPMDEARALKGLIDLTGMGTAEVAADIGFTQRYVQQRLQFLDLPEKMQERLNRGEIGIKEARSWLQNRPTIQELTDEQWLILLEIRDADQRKPEGGDIFCDAEATADPRLAAMNSYPTYHVYGPSTHYEAGFETGLHKISTGYSADEQLIMKFGEEALSPEQFEATLYGVQLLVDEAAAKSLKPGQYLTAWLNGPFEIAAERLEEIEQAKADRARQAAERAAQDVTRARRQGEAFNVAQSIEIQHRKLDLSPLDNRFAGATADIGMTLPVYVAINGDVVDAAGEIHLRSGWGQPPIHVVAKHRLIALAINAAAGLHTPDAPQPEPDAPPSRAEFLGMVAGNLEDDLEVSETAAESMAEAGLVAFLLQEGVAYGDDGYDWHFDGAMALAELIRVEGLGMDDEPAQIDIEEAIEALADDEATPDYLRNLAGPGSEAEAGQ